MIVGSIIFRIVSCWWQIIAMVIKSPFMILKIGFLWFAISFAASYLFFLLVHQYDVIHVRKDLAIALGRSFFMGFFVATMLTAVYQFILGNVMTSQFFQAQENMIHHLMISGFFIELYQQIIFLTILVSGLFAAHYVGEILDSWYEDHISNWYGWSMIAVTLLCCGFLYAVDCVL